jgi:hypothetical protein
MCAHAAATRNQKIRVKCFANTSTGLSVPTRKVFVVHLSVRVDAKTTVPQERPQYQPCASDFPVAIRNSRL